MVVRSDWYEVVVATIVLTNLALVLVSLFQEFETYRALEIAFTAFYFFEFIVRLIGEGPERMFKESRSWVDLSTVITSVLLLLADTVVNMTLTKLTRMVSILRVQQSQCRSTGSLEFCGVTLSFDEGYTYRHSIGNSGCCSTNSTSVRWSG